MASSTITPPAGFELEQPHAAQAPASEAGGITPPAGFVLESSTPDSQQQQSAPTQAPADNFGAPASVVGQIGLLGYQLLAAAENKYKQTIAQAQAVHDASVKEWKAGNYSRAIAIIAKAHSSRPNFFKSSLAYSAETHSPLMGRAARSAAVTHVFDDNTGKISPVNNTQ
jgi:hypothetical protein